MTKFDKHVIKKSSKNLFKEFFFSFLTLTRSATPRAITSDTLSGAKSKQNKTKQNKNKKQKAPIISSFYYRPRSAKWSVFTYNKLRPSQNRQRSLRRRG
jgi:hypothetical protein